MTEPAPEPVRVECYAGYRGAERPRRFFLADREVPVAEISVRWRTPDHHCFRVRGADDRTYLLRRAVDADTWDVTPTSTTP